MSLEIFEKAINEVSDKDWSWWPFLWLRPEQHAALSLTRLFVISMLYGIPCGAVSHLAVVLLEPRARESFPVLLVGLPLLFLFIGSVVVAPMWNRRAERLRHRNR